MSAELSASLYRLLRSIEVAEACARRHDEVRTNRDAHAALAQQADEMADDARRAARALIEDALPGVSWAELKALV